MPEVPTQTQKADKPDEELTIGEFVARHSQSSNPGNGNLRDMNNDAICNALGITTTELVQIQHELGHKLPEGAN